MTTTKRCVIVSPRSDSLLADGTCPDAAPVSMVLSVSPVAQFRSTLDPRTYVKGSERIGGPQPECSQK